MLAVSRDTARLFLYVRPATAWVGGRLILAALIPVLSRFGSDALKATARRFNQVAWTAFGVLIVTGIWNIVTDRSQVDHRGTYRTTLIVKLAVGAVSGVAAALHAQSRSAPGGAMFGALTAIRALAALFPGVLLAG